MNNTICPFVNGPCNPNCKFLGKISTGISIHKYCQVANAIIKINSIPDDSPVFESKKKL